MDTKLVLNNPEQAIIDRWGSVNECEHYLVIVELGKALKHANANIREVKIEKQLCSKEFKNAESDKAALKSQMQTISTRLGGLQTQKKQIELDLNAFFARDTQAQNISQPKQFAQKTVTSISESPITIIQIDDEYANQWDDYVSNNEQAALYHHYIWRDIIHQSFHHQSYYFAALSEGKIVGILPVTRLKSYLFGDFGVSLPYLNYGGVLADRIDIAQQLLTAAAKVFQHAGSEHLEIRTTIAELNNWSKTDNKISMIRCLPETTEQLSDELGSKLRAQIKKAQRESTEIVIGGANLLDNFYRVFAHNMRDLGTPVYAKSFFGRILNQYPERATIIVVKLDQQPVAAAFLLGHREMLEIPWASALRRTNPLSINMLLYWEVLKFAINQSYQYFDFGRSSKDASTHRFKKQWGAKPTQHYWYYWQQKDQPLPNLKPDNPKFQLLIRLWRLMPVWLTKLIGPHIVKNLP